jgi:hypothetical protein
MADNIKYSEAFKRQVGDELAGGRHQSIESARRVGGKIGVTWVGGGSILSSNGGCAVRRPVNTNDNGKKSCDFQKKVNFTPDMFVRH